MNTTRFTAAQRRTVEHARADGLVTCDVRTARALQSVGLLGPGLYVYGRHLVTAKLVSGPLLPDGVMRR
jgi:hypothetical protein